MKGNIVGRPMEVLLVEDNVTSAALTIAALQQSPVKHHVTWIQDGEEALELIFQQGKYARCRRPDLILLDLSLPKIDGREVLARVRADEELRQTAVVVMTASTDEQDQADVSRLQIEGYLTKPINIQKFLSLVKELRRYWHTDIVLPRAEGQPDAVEVEHADELES